MVWRCKQCNIWSRGYIGNELCFTCNSICNKVFYKFKTGCLEWDRVYFNTPYITVSELKRIIRDRSKINRIPEDLLIKNAETDEEYYTGEVIAPDTSLIVRYSEFFYTPISVPKYYEEPCLDHIYTVHEESFLEDYKIHYVRPFGKTPGV